MVTENEMGATMRKLPIRKLPVRTLILSGVTGLALASIAAAQQSEGGADRTVVVELFTSQGCSSCPPADEMMLDLAQRDGVIALAFHVDYWDYIGWEDVFGSAENTARQSAYARAAHTTTVYTPQFIVGGVDHVIGARGMELVDRIDAHAAQDTGVTVGAERRGDEIVISAQARAPAEMTVQLVRYSPLQSVAIERGENAGLTIDYANIVMDWHVVGEWDGVAPLSLTVAATGDLPSVILVQAQGAGPILGAVALD